MESTTDQATTRTAAGATDPAAPAGTTGATGATGATDLISPIDPAGAPFGAQSTPPSLSKVPATETRRKFRLRRSRTDRMLGGVCGGVAESLDVDAALVRIGLVTLTVLGVGSGVIIYAAVWLLAPETDEP